MAPVLLIGAGLTLAACSSNHGASGGSGASGSTGSSGVSATALPNGTLVSPKVAKNKEKAITGQTATTTPSSRGTAANSGSGNSGSRVPTTYPTASTTSTCHYTSYQGQPVLPDRHCTPGATDPAVTQASLAATVCTVGWLAKTQLSEQQSKPLRLASLVSYGLPAPTSGYGLDRLISLTIGGSPSAPGNLWPEPSYGPYGSPTKVQLEIQLHADVCASSGTKATSTNITQYLTLAQAQAAISTNWITAYYQYCRPAQMGPPVTGNVGCLGQS